MYTFNSNKILPLSTIFLSNINYMYIFIFLIIIIIILLIIMIFHNKVIDSFDNLVPDLYTFDTCCNENQIANCQTYGKTGVCNFYKNNKSCICQNAF